MFNPRSPYAPAAARQPMPNTPAPSMYAPRVQNRPIQQRQVPQQAPPQKSGGGMGEMMGMAGGMMSGLSDKNSKEEIRRLEGANEALTEALSSQASYPDTSAPSSGMQALGQQSSDTPAANKVAAQNVAMSGPPGDQSEYMRNLAPNSGAKFAERYSPGLAGATEYPYTWDARDAGARAAQVPTRGGMGQPDLSALDEAYKRMGRGG